MLEEGGRERVTDLIKTQDPHTIQAQLKERVYLCVKGLMRERGRVGGYIWVQTHAHDHADHHP